MRYLAIAVSLIGLLSACGGGDAQSSQPAASVASSSEQVPVVKYASVKDYLNESNNYSVEDGLSVIKSDNEFVIKPQIFGKTPQDQVETDIKYIAFDALINFFAHTDIQEFTVHIQPESFADLEAKKRGDFKVMKSDFVTLKAKREDVLKYLEANQGVKSFDEFVDTTGEDPNSFVGKFKGAFNSKKYTTFRSDNAAAWKFIDTFKVK